MLLATASSAVMSAVAHLATVAPSREWNTQNGGVRPPVFFYTVIYYRRQTFAPEYSKSRTIIVHAILQSVTKKPFDDVIRKHANLRGN